MQFSNLFKRIYKHLVLFFVILIATSSFFLYQAYLVNQKYLLTYANYDPRTYYNYEQTFTFEFPKDFELISAYDKYNKVATLQVLSNLESDLQSYESCKDAYQNISEQDLSELNLSFTAPKYVMNEKTCILPISISTRDFEITVKTSVPVSFELAENIGRTMNSIVENKAKQLNPETIVKNTRSNSLINLDERAAKHPERITEFAQYFLISLFLAVSLTILISFFIDKHRK